MLQRHTIEILHGNKGPVTMFPNLINGADVGMVQSGRSTRLSPEALQYLRVFCHILRQEFQSDRSTEFGILRLVHPPPAAASELLDDAVVRDGLANHGRHPFGAKSS